MAYKYEQSEIVRINSLFKNVSGFDRFVTKIDNNTFKNIEDENFDWLFKDSQSEIIYTVLYKYFKGMHLTEQEYLLTNNILELIKNSFKVKEQHKMSIIVSFLNGHHVGYTNKEKNNLLADIIIKTHIDYLNYYKKYQLDDKDFVLKILKNCNFSTQHDTLLISRLNEFFYNDSDELRSIIVKNPIIYDKLAKCGNKPNFSDEYLKKLVSHLGAKYFVSRLSHNLASDQEFMRQIILENPENLFRGLRINYRDEIRKNAFNLFGDNCKNIFNIYGMDYLIKKDCEKILDYFEYLKYNLSPKYLEDIKDKILSTDEQKILLLRGVFPKEFYKRVYQNYQINTFEDMLKFNFEVLKINYSEQLIKKLSDFYQKYLCHDFRGNMSLANNIVMAYKNGILKEFGEIAEANQYNANLIDMNMFSKEDIALLGTKIINQFCYYPNSLYILSQIKKEGDIALYKELVDMIDSDKLAPAIIPNILLYTVYSYKDAIISLNKNNCLNKENILLLINITENNKLLNIKSYQDVINYQENLDRFCDKEINSCQNVNYAKEIMFAKLLKTSRNNAEKFILTYKDGMKLKGNKDYIYLELLEIIDGLTDLQTIKKAYATLRKFKYFSKKSFEEFEETAKNSIIGKKCIIENKNNYKRIDYFGTELIIPQEDKEFNILVHVLGAFGDNPKADSVKESWNTTTNDNVSGICTTLVNNKTVQTALMNPSSIIFGFTQNLESENISMCAPYDIWSKNSLLEPVSVHPPKCIDINNLPDYQRGARGKYNEVVISRYLSGKKRQPDYIVVFDFNFQESISNSIEVAKSFNIPIMYIPTKKIFEYNCNKLKEEYNNYLINPTLENGSKLYTMYFTLKNGFDGIPNISDVSLILQEKDLINTILSKLSVQDKELFKTFIDKEQLKKKIITYEEDQRMTVEELQRKSSNDIFKQIREQYSFLETLRLKRILNNVNNENIMEEGKKKK